MFGLQQYSNNFFNSRKISADSIDSGSIRTDSLTSTSTTTTISGPLTTDTINEETAGAGVTIDSVLLKDGLVDTVDVSALKTDVDGFPDSLKNVDQELTTASDITFNNITVTGTVDGVDVAALKTDVDGFPDSLKNVNQELTTTSDVGFNKIEIASNSNIHWGSANEDTRIYGDATKVAITAPTAIELNANTSVFGNIAVTGTVDGVDVAALDTKVTDLVNSVPQIDQDLNTTDDVAFDSLALSGDLTMSAANTSDSDPTVGRVLVRGVIIDTKSAAGDYNSVSNYALSIRQDRNSSFGSGIYVRTAWGVSSSNNILMSLEKWNAPVLRVTGDNVVSFCNGSATINSGSLTASDVNVTGRDISVINALSVSLTMQKTGSDPAHYLLRSGSVAADTIDIYNNGSTGRI